FQAGGPVEGDVDGHLGPAQANGNRLGHLGMVLDHQHPHRLSLGYAPAVRHARPVRRGAGSGDPGGRTRIRPRAPSMTGLGFQDGFTPRRPDFEVADGRDDGPSGAGGPPGAETFPQPPKPYNGCTGAIGRAGNGAPTCTTTTPAAMSSGEGGEPGYGGAAALAPLRPARARWPPAAALRRRPLPR